MVANKNVINVQNLIRGEKSIYKSNYVEIIFIDDLQ